MYKKIFRLPSSLYRKIRYLIWRLANKYIFFKYKVQIANNFRIKGILFIRNAGMITIGSNFSANSGKYNNPIGGDTIMRLICQKEAIIKIGNNCGFSNSTIWAEESIVIEDNVFIGGGCRIWDNDFHPLDATERINYSSNVASKPVIIKKNSFIGGSSIILKGVVVGERSVIGAGSVVTKSIPDGEIWGGNPAKFIKKI